MTTKVTLKNNSRETQDKRANASKSGKTVTQATPVNVTTTTAKVQSSQAVSKKHTGYRSLVFIVAVAMLALFEGVVGLVFALKPRGGASADELTPVNGFYEVGEIYNHAENVQLLYDLVVGHNNATYAEVKTLAAQTTAALAGETDAKDNEIQKC